jgi:serine/threonine protein kinase
LERDVAIKVPHGSEMTAGFRERFLREARAAAHIHHPNVCPIYQAGTDGEVPYLVMHFVDGPTLGSLLEKRQTRFSPKQACVVIRKLALGVAAAHAQGVVHRDLKPQNVLVDEVRREVLITDFGVARVGDAGQTVEGDVIGTPAYMSPEQAQGKRTEVGPLSDVYSLGVILYRLLTGVVPYTGSVYEVLIQVYEGKPRPPQELRPGLDPRLCEICLKAMAKEPRDRYQSATDLATALETYMRSGNMESSGEREILVGAANRPEAPRKEAEARAGAAAVPEVETEIAFDLPTTARPMLSLMRNIAEAVFAKGLKELSVRVADVTFAQELARETIRRAKATRSTSLRQMVETTAGANIADAQVAAAQAAWEVAGTASEEDRLSLEMYLGQLPDTIRKPLKRAEDPTGTTVPREFSVETPEKFLEVLPRRVPRFRGGQAVPGRSDWVLVRWLGAGGFGEVWLAAHRRIPNRFGAVKFGIDLSRKQRELLTHEARLAAVALDRKPHPGLVPLLDTELGGETPWLMYEYIGGGDLTDLMLAWQQLPPAGRINAAVGRLRELAEAIAALHRLQPPVVHRDLKPANILRDSRTFQLRVTDFGIGGIAVENQVGRKRDSMLTELRGAHSLLYASPQQQRGAAPDPRDDVHALGVLAFHMLTGRLTSGVPTDYDRILRKLNVPVGLIQIIGACAAAEPNHRPRDAQAIVDMLAALDTASDQQRNAGPISLQPDNQKVTPVEVLVCPVCKARLQVPAGRTELVPCPRCSCQFPPAAGRKEILSLDPEPMPLPPPPPPVPAPAPIRRKRKRSEQPATEEETPRRSLRFYSCGCFLFLLAALGVGGFAYQDELISWGKTHLAKPIEFTPGREFETGADTARVYGFVRGEQSLLLTNSSRKDILATVWKAKNVAAMCNLKGGPAISTTVLDPKTTQFRYHNGRLAVFNRDPQAIDKGGVYLFDLIPAEKELD